MTTTNGGHAPTNQTDGNFWVKFGYSVSLLFVSFIFVIMTEFNGITILFFIFSLLFAIFFAWGTEKLDADQVGVFLYLEKFPVDPTKLKFTPRGGFVWRNPVTERILRFKTGMFPLDIEYKDVSTLNGDIVSGKIQLTLEIAPEFFDTLFQIVGSAMVKKSLDVEAVKKKVADKLNESVPARLGEIIRKMNLDEGYKFEEAIKDPDKTFLTNLKKALTTHRDSNGNIDQSKSDCFGLKLKSVEVPQPVIKGPGYEAYVKGKASEAGTKAAPKAAEEFNAFLDEFLKKYREDTGMQEKAPITPPTLYLELRAQAERVFAQKQGNNPNYYSGLGGSTRVNI